MTTASRISAKTRAQARQFRNNPTSGEEKFWKELRELKRQCLHVRRQVPIGSYIVDFAILKKKLVIEVDGHFHFEDEQMQVDAKRTAWLNNEGYQVLRFTTGDLDNMDGCITEVLMACGVMKR